MEVACRLLRVLLLLFSAIFLFRNSIEERFCQLDYEMITQLCAHCDDQSSPEISQLWELKPLWLVLRSIIIDDHRVVQEWYCNQCQSSQSNCQLK